jgi:hypothetical protein
MSTFEIIIASHCIRMHRITPFYLLNLDCATHCRQDAANVSLPQQVCVNRVSNIPKPEIRHNFAYFSLFVCCSHCCSVFKLYDCLLARIASSEEEVGLLSAPVIDLVILYLIYHRHTERQNDRMFDPDATLVTRACAYSSQPETTTSAVYNSDHVEEPDDQQQCAYEAGRRRYLRRACA